VKANGAQGRFWEIHDLLFQNQNALQRKDLFRGHFGDLTGAGGRIVPMF
jgi:hypothetical protein